MTNEECLNICEIAIKCFESKYSETLPVNNDCLEDFINQIAKKEEERQAINLIISALEKQIPKKPKEEWSKSPFSDDNGCLFQHLMCPNCGKMEVNKIDDFCPRCGQRISWEGTEDWSEKE